MKRKLSVLFLTLLILVFSLAITSCDKSQKTTQSSKTELSSIDIKNFDSYLLLANYSSEVGYIAADASNIYILDDSFCVKQSFPHSFSVFSIHPCDDLSFYITQFGSSDITKYALDPDNGMTLCETIPLNVTDDTIVLSFVRIGDVFYSTVLDPEDHSYRILCSDKIYSDDGTVFMPCRTSSAVKDSVYVLESSDEEKWDLIQLDGDFNTVSSIRLDMPVNSCCWIISKDIVVYDTALNGQICLVEANLSSHTEKTIVKFNDFVTVHSVVKDESGYSVFAASGNGNVLIKTDGKYDTIVNLQTNSAVDLPVYNEIRSEDAFTITIAYSDYESYINPKAEIQFKQWYPNAEIVHMDIGTTDQNDTYGSTLRQKLLANDTDFDLFFIMSPDSIPSIVRNEAYKNLNGMSQTIAGFDNFYDNIKDLCSFDGKIFGVPVRIRALAMGVNQDLVEKYNIDYDFANEPLTYDKLPEFLDKYCRDYDGDGSIDVYIDHYISSDDEYVSSFIPLLEVYENNRLDWLYYNVEYDQLLTEMLTFEKNELLRYCKPYNGKTDDVLFMTPTLSNLSVFPDDPTALYTFPITLSENDGSYLFRVYYLCANRYSKLDQKYLDDYLSLYTDPAFATSDNVDAFGQPYIEGKQLSKRNLALFEKMLEKAKVKCSPSKDFKSEWNKYRVEYLQQYENGVLSSDELIDALNIKLKFLING